LSYRKRTSWQWLLVKKKKGGTVWGNESGQNLLSDGEQQLYGVGKGKGLTGNEKRVLVR